MKTWLLALLLTLTFLQIAGCSVAPLKKIPVEKSMQVGIVVGDFPDKLTHTHVGTTVFANFEEQYPLGFDIREYVGDRCERKLEQQGYATKLLHVTDEELRALKSTAQHSAWDDSVSLAPNAATTLGALHSKYGVDLIIVYWSSKGDVPWGQNAFQAGEYGLFSRSFFNLDQFVSYSFVQVLALRMSPPAINAVGRYDRGSPMPSFPMPEDFHHLSNEALDLVRASLRERIDAFVDASTTNALGTATPVELMGATLR